MAKSDERFVDTRAHNLIADDFKWMRDPKASVQSKRRWTTREAVLKRIAELERLPPLRSKPTGYCYRYYQAMRAAQKYHLSDDEVRAIRAAHVPGDGNVIRRLAARYSISTSAVYGVASRRTYQHVE